MVSSVIDRRSLLARMAGLAAMSGGLASNVSAPYRSGRDIGPAPARRPMVSVSGLRPRINLFDVMSAQQVQDVRNGEGRDDSAAFAEALAAAVEVIVPAGQYRLGRLSIPGGRKIVGAGGRTVLRPLRGAQGQVLLDGRHSADISISDLVLDGDGSADIAAIFTDMQRVELRRVAVSRFRGHGLVLDGCIDSAVVDADFSNMGAPGGHAAVSMVDWTRPGHRNRVANIRGNGVVGRLIALNSQADSVVESVDHRNVDRGEAVYFLNCLRSRMDRIVHVGGGAKELGLVNPGNDGCAIDGGCYECSATNGLTVRNSGHGLSISGTKGFAGASRNVVRNWTSKYPDEGGVVVTDQGISGSSPSDNTVSDCYVENPGERVPEAAFSCFGGFGNRFVNCEARDTRAVKRMTVGFEEGEGRNGAGRNVWSGRVGSGEATRADVVRVR